MIQVPQGMMEQAAGYMPGLNTMANAYQQATQTLGPSLLSYMANMHQADQANRLAMATLTQNAEDRGLQREMMAPYYQSLSEAQTAGTDVKRLGAATDWLKAQAGTKDPMAMYKMQAQSQQPGWQQGMSKVPLIGGLFQPSQEDIAAAQLQMQLQALQQAGLTPPQQVAVPKSFVPTKK